MRSERSAAWTVIGGSALGGRHQKTGLPNQDSWASETVVHRGQEYIVMAVADGHGGKRYVRSEVGSKLAVSVAMEVMRGAVTKGVLSAPPRSVEKQAGGEVASSLVAMWRRRCLDHLSGAPFTEDERARAGEPLEDEPLLSYGSTVLVAVLGPNRCLIMQLGDGDSLVALADGQLLDVLPPDGRLTGGETTSLCLDDAESDFRVALVEHPSLSLVLLSSDGYGVAFADPNWRSSVVRDLMGQIKDRGVEQVERSLPGWLSDSAEVGGDDVTVALAFRRSELQAEGAPAKRGLAGLVAAAVLAGIALGGVGGWLAAGARSVVPGTVEATTSTIGSETTSSTGTSSTTTPRSNPATTIPGGPDQGEEGQAFIVDSDGTVVAFIPDPTMPEPVIVDEGAEIGESRSIYAWARIWTVDAGRIVVDESPLGLELSPELAIEGLEFEGGLVWALADEGTWLIVIDDPGQTCAVFSVAAGVGAPVAVGGGAISTPECSLATGVE